MRCQLFEDKSEKLLKHTHKHSIIARGGSRTAATSKMERFVIIVNGFQPLTIITKRSILDVAAVLDPPLVAIFPYHFWVSFYPFLPSTVSLASK